MVDARADVFALGGILTVILTSGPVFRGNSAPELVQRAAEGATDDALVRLANCGADAQLAAIVRHCVAVDRDNRPADGKAVASLVSEYRQGVERRLRQAEADRAAAEAKATEQRKRRHVVQIAGTTAGLIWAEKSRRAAVAAEQAGFGPNHAHTLLCLNNLATAYKDIGEVDKAIPLYEEALQRMQASLGPTRADTLLCMNNLAAAHEAVGDVDKALPLLREGHQLSAAHLGRDHPYTLLFQSSLASVEAAQNLKLVRAGRLGTPGPVGPLQAALKLMQGALGRDHPMTLTAMHTLALGYNAAGDFESAVPLFEETLELREAKLGRKHPDTLLSMSTLSLAYMNAGELEKAVSLQKETLRLTEAKFGPDHAYTLFFMRNLAVTYQDAGEYEQAVTLHEETFQRTKAKFGDDNQHTLLSMEHLASAYSDAGDFTRALPLYEETVQQMQAHLGANHVETLTAMHNQAWAHQAAGDLKQAIAIYEQTLQLRKAKLGPNHQDSLTTTGNLARAYAAAGDFTRALPLYEERFKSRHATLGPDHSKTLASMRSLARACLKTGDLQRALPLLREHLAIYERMQLDSWQTAYAQAILGAALVQDEQYDQAEALLLAAYEGIKAREGAMPPCERFRLTRAIDGLIDLYSAWKRPDEVKRWQAVHARHVAPRPPVDLGDVRSVVDFSSPPPEAATPPQLSVEKDYNRGYALHKAKKYSDAVAAFTQVLEHNANHLHALHYRAHCHERLGEPKSAIADFTAALAIEPENAHLITSQASNHYFLRRWESCAEDCRRVSLNNGYYIVNATVTFTRY